MAADREPNLGEDILNHMVTDLRLGLEEQLVSIILFGSRARGDASSDSDWDLLVIARDLLERAFPRRLWLKRILCPDCRGAVSILAKTPQEFEFSIPSLYLDIALDGRILYDPQGYAEKKIQEILQIIERLGLYRERTEAGDVWRWREPCSGPWELKWGA
jgi:hypothetical protein